MTYVALSRNQIQSSFICQRRLRIGRRHGHNETPHMGTVIYTTEKQQGLLLSKQINHFVNKVKEFPKNDM